MNITYYNQEQFLTAAVKYETQFDAELMPIKNIMKLPKWGMVKKIIYVIMNEGANIVAFARVQPVRTPKTLQSAYYGKCATRFIQHLYDIQDLFIFKKYRGQKLCTEFISYIRTTAPVESTSLFVISLSTNNVPALRCCKRAEFIEINPDDELAKCFDEFWKKAPVPIADAKHMIVSRKTLIPDNDKFNAKVKKLMKDEFGISNHYVDNMIYLTNASGIVSLGPGILNTKFLKAFGEHFSKTIHPLNTEWYILEVLNETKESSRNKYSVPVNPDQVRRVHQIITNWAWEVAPLW